MTTESRDPYLHGFFSQFEPQLTGARTKVLFIVGSTGISGGTNLILQNALGLIEAGCEVTIAALRSRTGDPWHPVLRLVNVLSLDEAETGSYDMVIATWWPTVYHLPRFKAHRYAYFVQSIESRFLGDDPRGGRHEQLAHLTYTFDLDVITVARWLEVYLAREFDRPAFLVRNGIDKALFSAHGPHLSIRPTELGRPPRLLIEGPRSVPFKGVARAAADARDAGFDDVWHVGSDAGDLPGVRTLSSISYDQMPQVYRSCDVLLKLSEIEGMYGPPLEMFHCGGTAVTFDVTGYSEYVKDGANSLVAPMGDHEAVRTHLRSLLNDAALLSQLKLGALDTARRWPSIADTREDFARTVLSLMSGAPRDQKRTLLEIRGVSDGTDL